MIPTGAYARLRQQFGIPIGKFEGIQTRLGRMAATCYRLDAARRLACAGLDEGRKLAVISAIMKAHATYHMREAVNDAMDVHAGKAVIDGPLNYLGNLYRTVPLGITVEGANILMRSMIIFGQGSIRYHPWLLKEMRALEEPDREKALAAFDNAFWGHVGHSCKTLGRAWLRCWTGGRVAPAPAALVIETESLREKMRRAGTSDIEEALKKGVLSQHEAEKMQEADAAVSQAIAVDDFSRDDLIKGG